MIERKVDFLVRLRRDQDSRGAPSQRTCPLVAELMSLEKLRGILAFSNSYLFAG